MWIVSLKSCFNCICKRTDLMCKSDCSKKITGLMEEYDEPEGCEDEEPENIYDDLEPDEDDKGNMIMSSGFEERWKDKVRLIPESLDSNYMYHDPNEEENRRNAKETQSKTMLKSFSICRLIHSDFSFFSDSKNSKPFESIGNGVNVGFVIQL